MTPCGGAPCAINLRGQPLGELRFRRDFVGCNSARHLPRMVEAAIAPMKPVFAQLAWITRRGGRESGRGGRESGREAANMI